MEGNDPAAGALVDMNVIVAGTTPLATGIATAALMGFEPLEIPTFACANQIKPERLDPIEVRGHAISELRRVFVRPQISRWDGVATDQAVHLI